MKRNFTIVLHYKKNCNKLKKLSGEIDQDQGQEIGNWFSNPL